MALRKVAVVASACTKLRTAWRDAHRADLISASGMRFSKDSFPLTKTSLVTRPEPYSWEVHVSLLAPVFSLGSSFQVSKQC